MLKLDEINSQWEQKEQEVKPEESFKVIVAHCVPAMVNQYLYRLILEYIHSATH
jgi:hypothetical protein